MRPSHGTTAAAGRAPQERRCVSRERDRVSESLRAWADSERGGRLRADRGPVLSAGPSVARGRGVGEVQEVGERQRDKALSRAEIMYTRDSDIS